MLKNVFIGLYLYTYSRPKCSNPWIPNAIVMSDNSVIKLIGVWFFICVKFLMIVINIINKRNPVAVNA